MMPLISVRLSFRRFDRGLSGVSGLRDVCQLRHHQVLIVPRRPSRTAARAVRLARATIPFTVGGTENGDCRQKNWSAGACGQLVLRHFFGGR